MSKERNIYPYRGGYYLNWQALGQVYRKFHATLKTAVTERNWLDRNRSKIEKRLAKALGR